MTSTSDIKPTLELRQMRQGNNFLAKLRVPQKLLLLTAILAVPLAVIAVILGNNYYQDLQDSYAKQRVAAVYVPLQNLQRSARLIQGRQPEDVTPEMISNFKQASEDVVTQVESVGLPKAMALAGEINRRSQTILTGLSNKTITFQSLFDISTALLRRDVNPLFSVLSERGALLQASSCLLYTSPSPRD